MSSTVGSIKPLLEGFLIQKYDLEPDFLKEMRFSNDLFRADLISVSNTLEAFEITSQSDDLRQLTKQINAYLTFFEHVTLLYV